MDKEQVLKLYAVHSWDGGSCTNFKFYLTSAAESEAWKRAQPYDDVFERTIEIFDTVAEWHDWENVKLRKQALAKLSAEERKALGF